MTNPSKQAAACNDGNAHVQLYFYLEQASRCLPNQKFAEFEKPFLREGLRNVKRPSKTDSFPTNDRFA